MTCGNFLLQDDTKIVKMRHIIQEIREARLTTEQPISLLFFILDWNVLTEWRNGDLQTI